MTVAFEKAMPAVLSVSQLAARIKAVLEGGVRSVDVEGEISVNTRGDSPDVSMRPSAQGHYYFSLKDAGAVIPAVLFRWQVDACVRDGILREDQLRNGAKVKVRGSITLYAPRGTCQIVVKRIRIAGAGDLMQRYLELKAALAAEGLFDPARKRKLPEMPRRIGIVTSETGAVIHDMCTVLTRRFPNLEITLFPSLVQGADAPRTLVAGIEHFNRQKPDLVIIARGGGSFEDLFCFNDETLVRAVAACAVPIISAVGHETDFTLCDFAADARAGTPSIAAEMAVPVKDELVLRLTSCNDRLTLALRAKGEWFEQRLDHLSDSLVSAISKSETRASTRLERVRSRLSPAAMLVVTQASMRVERSAGRLKPAMSLAYALAEARLVQTHAKLDLLSPYGVLERGYALVTAANGSIVRDATHVKKGMAMDVRLSRGHVGAEATDDGVPET